MKVNVIKIQNGNTETIATLSVPSKEVDGAAKIFDWIRRFEIGQASEIFGTPIKTLNVGSYTNGPGFLTTYRNIKGQSQDVVQRNTYKLDGRTFSETRITQTEPVILADGTGADFCAGFDFYPEGYILATGTIGANIFGMKHDQYVASMSETRIKYGSHSAAKLFPTLKKLKETLEKKEDFLHFFADKNGFNYSFEPVNQFFADEEAEAEEKSARRKASDDALRKDIEETLARINHVENTSDSDDSFVPGATPKEEAVNRMKELHLMGDVITKFKKGHLLVSEAGGILYDPDEHALDAIEDTKKYGTPYHVIRSGEMYSVLYVSKYPEEWEMEHYDVRSHCIIANVWNKDGEFSEIGDIGVSFANGGLVRTA